MSRTRFDQAHQDFSNAAHTVAQHSIYPHLFPQRYYRDNWISFETTSVSLGGAARILDGEMATDRIVRVHGYNYMAPFCFSVQERFREPDYLKRFGPELTITEWNHASDLPSELYKLYAGIFVYGYFDKTAQAFSQWIAVNTSAMMIGLLGGAFNGISTKPNAKKQDFLCIPFEALTSVPGVVVAHSGAAA